MNEDILVRRRSWSSSAAVGGWSRQPWSSKGERESPKPFGSTPVPGPLTQLTPSAIDRRASVGGSPAADGGVRGGVPRKRQR